MKSVRNEGLFMFSLFLDYISFLTINLKTNRCIKLVQNKIKKIWTMKMEAILLCFIFEFQFLSIKIIINLIMGQNQTL